MKNVNELEERVLEILYQKSISSPLWITESEIYWSIPDMNVTERDVREALDRLVYQRRVMKKVGKYQIEKVEFLAIKERLDSPVSLGLSESVGQNNNVEKESGGKNCSRPSVREWNGQGLVSLLVCLSCIIFGFLLCLLLMNHKQNQPFSFPELQLPQNQLQVSDRSVFLSSKKENQTKNLRKIETEFTEQQKVNRLLNLQADSVRMSVERLRAYVSETNNKQNARLQEERDLILTVSLLLVGLLVILVIALLVRKKE